MKKKQKFILANAVIWASLILATALIVTRVDSENAFSYALIVVFIPLWFASDQLVRKALRKGDSRAE